MAPDAGKGMVEQAMSRLAETIVGKQVAALRERQIDVMVAMSPENATYTAGMAVPSQSLIRSRLVMCVVCASGHSLHLVADMEESFTRSYTGLQEVRAYNEFTEHPADALADALRELGVGDGTVALEMDYVPVDFFERLRFRVPRARFVDAGPLLAELRAIKTPEEIGYLRKLGAMVEKAHYQAASQVKPGMTEMDLALAIYECLFREGVDGVARLVVGAGERSTHANPDPTSRKLAPGDVVRVDVYAVLHNYLSDVARTAVVGEPNGELKEIWRKLVDARRFALDMVRPGARADDIYRAYYEHFTDMGLRPLQFLGHGLGLTLHEEPYVSKYGHAVLQEGMVLCIEPYTTLPDCGFQVEDELVVTSSGFELITGRQFPVDDLIQIG
ncbi:MAG TPA: aminopeptidase P family protein [Firmicutes bacterium]|nr:aminopeptidase P family protein [Bacillota bacterium]